MPGDAISNGGPPGWAFKAPPPPQPAEVSGNPAMEVQALVDTAWRDLLRDHLPFHEPPEEVRARLLSTIRDVDRALLESGYNGRLYYAETYRESPAQTPLPVSESLSHVIVSQARLMEDACEALQLYRYANAPSNRGFMNLFRRWGNSPTFNEGFDEVRDLFPRRFVRFYDDYIRYRQEGIDLDPVPHPWDEPKEMREQTPLDHEEMAWYMLVNAHQIAGRPETVAIPGVFLDSGIFDASSLSQPTEMSHGTPEKEGKALEQRDDHSGGPSHGVPNA